VDQHPAASLLDQHRLVGRGGGPLGVGQLSFSAALVCWVLLR
jgi:hypothetical protein